MPTGVPDTNYHSAVRGTLLEGNSISNREPPNHFARISFGVNEPYSTGYLPLPLAPWKSDKIVNL